MTHVTCRLTAKNGDQLQNPTLGNRVWATFLSSSYDIYFFFTDLGLIQMNEGINKLINCSGGLRTHALDQLKGSQISCDLTFSTNSLRRRC